MGKWSKENWNRANCYGYATNTNEWLLLKKPYENGFEEIVKKHPEWKVVSKKDIQWGKEYVAFRYGGGDFHFMKRDKFGHWSHKPGGTAVCQISKKEVFADVWQNTYLTYDGPLYLFEVLNS